MTQRNTEDIARILEIELTELYEGGAADLKNFAAEMAEEVVAAAAAGDDATLAHLKAQTRLIAGSHRLSASAAAHRTVSAVVGVLARTLIAAIALLLLVLPSCVAPGQVVAADIKPAVDLITAEYDRALDGSTELADLTDAQKRTRHRSATLLRRLVDQAFAARPETPEPR